MSPPTDPVPIEERALYELAHRFSPVLRFHQEERFFPALAESWLTHTTEAPWDSDGPHWLGDLTPDAHRRGMALCTHDRGGALRVIAGQPVDGDRPLLFSDAADDPYAIGRPDLRVAGRRVFLDLAGWQPGSGESVGDLERLYALWSELSAAANPSLEWTPLLGHDDLPHAWIPVSPNPTTYCEVTWAGDYARINSRGGTHDLPDGDHSLDPFLALTYHYLYPAKEPVPDGTGEKVEGQWEAATVFFNSEGASKPHGGIIQVPPAFVVVSQGIDQPGSDHHRTELKPWNEVEMLGEHPVLYVGKGSHHFFFTPVGGTTGTPPPTGTNPGSDPGPHDDDRHEGQITDLLLLFLILVGVAALVGAILLALGVGIIIIALVVVALLLLALWALFEWFKSLFDAGSNDNSGDPVSGGGGNDEAGGGGTQGGGSEPPGDSPPPGGGDGGVGSSGGGTYGLPNTGSPTGRATVSFDVRVIGRLPDQAGARTGYPSERRLENPYWWDYSGGWGVRIKNGFSTGWQHGTRRVDELGRSWSYWTGVRLATVLAGGSRQG